MRSAGRRSSRSSSSRFAPRSRPAVRSRSRAPRDAGASASRTRSSSATPSTRGPPAGADAPFDPLAREGRGEELAELALEPGDLAPQLGPGEALVGGQQLFEACRRRVRAMTRGGGASTKLHMSPFGGRFVQRHSKRDLWSAINRSVTPRQRRGITPEASQSASSTAICGHARDLDRDEQRRVGPGWTPRPSAGAPNSSARGRRSSAITSVPRAAIRAGPRAPRPAPVSRMPSCPSTRSASNARSATPDLDDRDRQRVVEQVAAHERRRRSSARGRAAPPGSVSSGSRPMWRKKTR